VQARRRFVGGGRPAEEEQGTAGDEQRRHHDGHDAVRSRQRSVHRIHFAFTSRLPRFRCRNPPALRQYRVTTLGTATEAGTGRRS
jgi:hypothetical protein